MTALTAVREIQLPLLAAMLLGACGAKFARSARLGAADNGSFGPTILFPANLRKPLALTVCGIEAGLGIGLIVTAGKIGSGTPATCVRIATCVLFLIFTSALIELRTSRPGVGCGCFGDLSTAPVSSRTIARSALLAFAALATVHMPPIADPASAQQATTLAGLLFTELLIIGIMSPEIGEGLVRLGYAEPCELRDVPVQRTVAALHRSRQWHRYSRLATARSPTDVWRELCWRYLVYPGSYQGRPADLVFAVFLQQRRRPIVRVALVDAATGETVQWPGPATKQPPDRNAPRYARLAAARVGAQIAPGPAVSAGATVSAPTSTSMPFSSDI